jgi:hypothetical protein
MSDVMGELHVMFAAANQGEANSLTELLLDAVSEVLCPADEALQVPCSHCAGTLLNPADDAPDDPDEARWQPGAPCAACTPSGHPGTEQPCVRDHFESGTVWVDGPMWLDGEDRRNRAFYRRLLDVWAQDGETVAKAMVETALRDMEDDAS